MTINTLNTMMDKGLLSIFGGVDLDSIQHIGHVVGIEDSGGADVRRQNPVCPDHGLSPMEHFSSYRSEIQRRPSGALSSLCRAISNNGFRPTYLSGESPRYRSLLVGSGCKALSHGSSRTGQSIHPGRRQRIPRLAHLCRLRSTIDSSSKKALFRRELRCRHIQYRICTGCHDYRPLSVDVSLGSFSNRQGCRKSSYSDGPPRFYPKLYSYLRWQAARCQCSRSAHPEAGAFYVMDRAYLDFERLYVLHQAGSFFVTRAKSNHGCQTALFRSQRSICRRNLRSDHRPQWFLQPAAHFPEHLRRIRFKDAESGKTLLFLTNHHTLPALTICCTLQKTLANRIVLQMDQTTSPYKTFLWSFRKRRQIPNLDCGLSLCSYCDHQEEAQSRCFALHFITDSIGHHLRENALAASISRKWNSVKYYGKS